MVEQAEKDFLDAKRVEQRVFEEAHNPSLPSFLRLSPEQIKDEAARQQILRDLHTKGSRQTPGELKVGRAMAVEQSIRANLELIDKQAQPEVYAETVAQLVESLAEQGRLSEAAQYDASYQELIEAVDRDDDEMCDCPSEIVTIQERNARGEAVSKTVEIPNTFVETEVFSQKHGKLVPLVRCAKCGFRNISETHDNRNNIADVEK